VQPFRGAFTAPTWQHVMVLVMGAILVPGRRTLASALRVMGLDQVPNSTNYHRVLNRNKWSACRLSRRLFSLLVAAFIPSGEPVVVSLDDSIERRWVAKIKKARHLPRSRKLFTRPLCQGERPALALAQAAARDRMGRTLLGDAVPARSSPVPTLLGKHKQGQRQYKKLTDWAKQVLIQVALWLPDRRVGVGDASFASIDRNRRASLALAMGSAPLAKAMDISRSSCRDWIAHPVRRKAASAGGGTGERSETETTSTSAGCGAFGRLRNRCCDERCRVCYNPRAGRPLPDPTFRASERVVRQRGMAIRPRPWMS
jgi:hypothetical protein